MKQLDKVHPGKIISAKDFNDLIESVQALGRLSVETPLEYVDGNLRIVPDQFWAIIVPDLSASPVPDASDCCAGWAYSWLEVLPSGDGTWQTIEGGRSGTQELGPAYETNGNCVAEFTIVRMFYGLNGEYLFDQCCASCQDNTPSSSSVSSDSTSSSSSDSISSIGSTSSVSSGSTTGDYICIPFLDCDFACRYLNIPSSLGIFVSNTACASSSSNSSSSHSSVSHSSTSSDIALGCCPEITLPAVLHGVISAPSGAAISCFAGNDIYFYYIGGGVWETNDLGCSCIPGGYLQFSCNSSTLLYQLNIPYVLQSAVCSPTWEVTFTATCGNESGGFNLIVLAT